jgi:hypothetical protein
MVCHTICLTYHHSHTKETPLGTQRPVVNPPLRRPVNVVTHPSRLVHEKSQQSSEVTSASSRTPSSMQTQRFAANVVLSQPVNDAVHHDPPRLVHVHEKRQQSSDVIPTSSRASSWMQTQRLTANPTLSRSPNVVTHPTRLAHEKPQRLSEVVSSSSRTPSSMQTQQLAANIAPSQPVNVVTHPPRLVHEKSQWSSDETSISSRTSSWVQTQRNSPPSADILFSSAEVARRRRTDLQNDPRRAALIQAAAEELLQNHDCRHDGYGWSRGPKGVCQMCRHYLPIYLFVRVFFFPLSPRG